MCFVTESAENTAEQPPQSPDTRGARSYVDVLRNGSNAMEKDGNDVEQHSDDSDEQSQKENVPVETQTASTSKVEMTEEQHVMRKRQVTFDSEVQCVEVTSELQVECAPESSAQDLVPQERPRPLPMRAIRSRMQSRSSPPSWAAWLPTSLQQPFSAPMQEGTFYGQVAPVAMMPEMNSDAQEYCYTTDPESGVSVAWAPVLVPANAFQNYGNYAQPDAVCTNYVQPDSEFTGYAPPEAEFSGYMQPNSEFTDFVQPQAECTNYSQPSEDYNYYGQMDGQAVESTVTPILGKVWKLSRDVKGCRKVQQAFDDAADDQERLALAEELVGHVWEAIKCQNANHVLQKCISLVPAEVSQFVIDEIWRHGSMGVAQAARHRFGCRVMERLLESCTAEQLGPTIEAISKDAVALASHPFGNFVVIHVIDHYPEAVAYIAESLEQHLIALPADGYAGAVIAAALKHEDVKECCSLATALLQDVDRVATMACSRWGHQAIKRALQMVDDDSRQQACNKVLRCSDQLRYTRYGRQVAGLAAQEQNLQCICAH